MKKFIAPIVLFLLAAGLVAYLTLNVSGTTSSFNADEYLQARGRIDSLQIALYEAQNSPDAQLVIRNQLDSSWQVLNGLRTQQNAMPKQENLGGLSADVWMWIAGGAAAIILCIILLVLALKRRERLLTQQMESVAETKTFEKPVAENKNAESQNAEEPRFKAPRNGFENDPTIAPKPRQKRSIIDDVADYAEKSAPKVVFEDENGVPENKILTTDLNRPPQLRPTARERITSAMQSLSDVLRSPRGLTRDRTMKLRAQSHNVTGDPTLGGSHPLDTSRFDREFTEKTKILQMSRRGFPASAIAMQLKIPQEQVEEVIKNALESGN